MFRRRLLAALPVFWCALVLAWFSWFAAFASGPERFAESRLNAFSLATAAPEENFTLPLLPVTVLVRDRTAPGDRATGLCSSDLLKDRLRRRAFQWVVGGDAEAGWRPDFLFDCDEKGPDGVHAALKWPDGTAVYGLTVRRIGGADGDELAARTLAIAMSMKGERVAVPAAAAYMAGNLRQFTERGAAKLQAGVWDEASELLHLGLESPLDPSALYYGLASAYANQGLSDQAYWYFAAYLASARKDPEELADKAWEVLGDMADPTRGSRAEETFRRWQKASGARDWNAALGLQKLQTLETPWDEALYERTADAYRRLGWTALEDNWRARLRLARDVNGGRARMERLRRVTGL